MKINLFMFAICFAVAWGIILIILDQIDQRKPKKHCGDCSKSIKSGKFWPSSYNEACSYHKKQEFKDLNEDDIGLW